MEIHIFTASNVESRLSEIRDMLHMIQLSVIGLEAMGTVSMDDASAYFCSMELISNKVRELETGRKTVTLDWSEDKTLMLVGV